LDGGRAGNRAWFTIQAELSSSHRCLAAFVMSRVLNPPMRGFLTGLCLLLFAGVGALAQEQIRPLEFTRYTMPNGMTVISMSITPRQSSRSTSCITRVQKTTRCSSAD
jgi:hypothetical protein